MPGFLIIFVVFVLLYCVRSWILPKILAWIIEKKFRVAARIGHIGLPYIKLYDVNITKQGFTIHIDEIGIRSSFFNSEVSKLVTLVVTDVRINKDIDSEEQDFEDVLKEQMLDFRGRKVPNIITTFAQFMAVHVYNISAILLHSNTPEWLVHATAKELHLDGSIVQNSRTLLVNVNLTEALAKILKHRSIVDEETCLGELRFAISMEAMLMVHGSLSVENLSVSTSHTNATINDGFYTLVQETGHKSTTNGSATYDENVLYYNLLPIIPKHFSYTMEDTSIRGVKENSRTEFVSSLKTLTFTSHFLNTDMEYVPHIQYLFRVTDFQVYNSKEKLLLLKSFRLNAELENHVFNVFLQLNTLAVTYNHDTIYKWVKTNFMPRTSREIEVDPLGDSGAVKVHAIRVKEGNLLERLLRKVIIKLQGTFCQVSVLFKFNSNNSYAGFNHFEFKFDQSNKYSTFLPNIFFLNSHWESELQMQSFWWSFKEITEDVSKLKKLHYWGTPFFLGMAIIKVISAEKMEMKIETLFNALQLEWSPYLAEYTLLALRCFKQYSQLMGKKRVYASKSLPDYHITANMALSNFNMFFLTEMNEYIVLRLNCVAADKTPQTVAANLTEMKITIAKATKNVYTCVRSEDIQYYSFYIKTVQTKVNLHHTNSEYLIQLLDETVAYWSTNLHLKMFNLYREIVEFCRDLCDEVTMQSHKEMRRYYVWSLKVFGFCALNVKISEKHAVKIAFDYLSVLYKKGDLSLSNTMMSFALDDSDIFILEGINLLRLDDNEMIKEERIDAETFLLPWNNPWSFTIDVFKACFPYAHFYADAVQSELISIWKWLKSVHSQPSKAFTVDSPLPRDLLINVREFLFEMSDDPFEVKLRDNYELLEDEYNESVKRQKKLKEKITELCMTHLHLPAGKVEELYANLRKKNAEIYVQRSKQMLLTSPPRTRLFAWSMTNVEILMLADPSIHGTENVVRIMREIDADSPWPEENIDFQTLWCRMVSFRCKEWKFQLRDFPQPLLHIKQCYVCGQLVGAEQAAPRRAKRDVMVELGEPWGYATIERSMLPLKFYHDFNCEVESFSYAFGPCWEPVIAQCHLTFEKIFAPSRDPSPPLHFWDKMRLLLHGRLTMVVQQLTVLLHASLDPYNTTEEMELTWKQVIMDWTNSRFVYKGDLNIFVRTASKYDDCQLLHIPNLKLIVNLNWVCLGNPNDHHSVIQCAPDKIPEYSSNQIHDSFRAFRSQNVNLSIVLETKAAQAQSPTSNLDCTTLSLYGSTLRWIENLKLILSGVTRPTRRGKIFDNIRPRRTQLSRHYKKVHLLMGLHKFQVCYWMSFAMQRGFELLGGRLSSSSEHTLSLVHLDDALKHRPKTEWSIVYMNSELNDTEIWLKSALQEESEKEMMSLRQPVEKCFCLSVAKVSYGREAVLHATDRNKDTPTHRLVVYDLKGAWTKSNRNVAFAMFDSFMRNLRMKKNLSTEALKGFRKETTTTTPLKRRNNETRTSPNSSLQGGAKVAATPSPLTKLQSGHAANMLKQLIAEADNKAVVFSDDLSSATRQQQLQGLQACQEDDVVHKNWLIALVNAQVLLKGCETRGYVILSAAKAEILQRIHRPVWRDRTLVSKSTWVGSLECLQYYATVNAGENDSLNENIMWLTIDNIQEKESTVISEIPQVPNMVGSGVSVGAVVSDTVGASSNTADSPIQLQRIVSRCKCEFFYAGYGDITVDPEELGEVPPPLQEEVGLWDRRQTAVDAFSLMHHDLDVCTNSLQYAMLLDIVNNLLLYVEPHRKEALEKLQRMRFQLQLHSTEDQRRPIQTLQNQIRSTASKLRRLEKETYLVNKALVEEPNSLELIAEMEKLENAVYECKNQLNAQSEELDMMISCYKESQLLANSRLATTRNDKPLAVVRANEICFKHAQWRLTEADGQIGIADLVLSNFLYTKNSKSDDSVEHLLELGYVRMTNLLPNQIYKEVLCPTEIQSNMPVEHKRVVRVFCREKPPVGGISVKEHFEINVVPLTIAITKKFYNTMLKFCFPEKDPETIEGERGEEIDSESRGKKYRSSGRGKRDSNFYIAIDDIEKMKERAEKNKLFIYIKIPEVPVRVSYKGNKEKNLEDIRDFSLVIPTLEYHNVTWTWLDLLLAMKSDTRRVILSQAIKQKLQIKRSTGLTDESSSPHEEDKARMLFGSRHTTENRSMKRGMTNVFKLRKQQQ